MSNKQNRYLVKDALRMAIEARNPKLQYRASDYQAILATHKMIPSMSRKGNCHDYVVAESFFSHLKNELIYHKNFADRDEARSAIFDYIAVFL